MNAISGGTNEITGNWEISKMMENVERKTKTNTEVSSEFLGRPSLILFKALLKHGLTEFQPSVKTIMTMTTNKKN